MAGKKADIWQPVIERPEAAGRVILVCEHASNHIPDQWDDLGLTADQRQAHIAWDPGALGVARGLAERLDATLIHAPVSRLVYDLNRAPDMAGAMPARSEVHDIPGNAAITATERLARTEAIYLPWTNGLHNLIANRIALGRRPVVITIHSFTPIYHGRQRLVEFGVIHDADAHLSVAILDAAHRKTRLQAELNSPYSAADDVTHTLRVHATPYGLPNAMLEIRNDLIATPEAQAKMAETLAPVLNMGIEEIQKQAKAS
ncbi:N-formylglutamate amidohydrolase [Fuscibacter oryzae]|uniref:N-formylglutamate amidohydrolase n=1 Tax=Fuscibacter oryzae TaxID=2803939 RepID=A0A8J7MR78_9RHOB|nr:N-formylglutamate amidohydrolase [Fuscibacter oryzae]MBL4928728.1 N-formylglutamate amidohydrolase [Fuscibacter oryzae]